MRIARQNRLPAYTSYEKDHPGTGWTIAMQVYASGSRTIPSTVHPAAPVGH